MNYIISKEALDAIASADLKEKNEFIIKLTATMEGVGAYAVPSPSYVQAAPYQVPFAHPYAHPMAVPGMIPQMGATPPLAGAYAHPSPSYIQSVPALTGGYATPSPSYVQAVPQIVGHAVPSPSFTQEVPGMVPFAHPDASPVAVPGQIPEKGATPPLEPKKGSVPMLVPDAKAKHIEAYLNTGNTALLKEELDKIDARNKAAENADKQLKKK